MELTGRHSTHAMAVADVMGPPPRYVAPAPSCAFTYEQAVRQCQDRLLAVARRLLRNDEDARDTVQDAFLSAFRSLDRFERRAQVSTWLHRIVVNTALMKLRSRRRKPEERVAEIGTDSFDSHHQETSGWQAPESPETTIQRRELRALVHRSIDSLPENYRTVLVLRDIQELDTQETAAALGVSSITVRCRLHRAHRALRGLMGPRLRPNCA